MAGRMRRDAAWHVRTLGYVAIGMPHHRFYGLFHSATSA
jgi:hypothetical protein